MVRFGNFFFKYRNVVFPLCFAVLVLGTRPIPGGSGLDRWRYALGFSVALSGQLIRALTIGLAYIIRGGRNRRVYAKDLVTEGIFAHSRNPLYVGNLLIVTGLGVLANSLYFYIVGIPLFMFMYAAIVRAEEAFLTRKFGEEYIRYCKAVNRFVPKLSGITKTIGSMTFRWRRLIIKEYGTTYTWLACAVLLIMKNDYIRFNYHMDRNALQQGSAALALVTCLYLLARYLKKSGRLVDA